MNPIIGFLWVVLALAPVGGGLLFFHLLGRALQ
jgi:hypothetical protein